MVSPVAGANLLSFYQGQTALGLLTSSSSGSSSSSAGSTSTNTLLNYLTNKEGLSSSSSSSAAKNAPIAPWNSQSAVPTVNQAVMNALGGAPFVDPSSAKLSAPGGVSAGDYKGLFALYQGLNTLNDLATTAAAAATSSASSSLSNIPNAQLQASFSAGMNQVQNYLSNAPFNAFNLTAGKVSTSAQSTVGIPNGAYQTYTTGIIGTGDESSPLKALQGPVQFTITVTPKYGSTPTGNIISTPNGNRPEYVATPVAVNIDLSNMGSRPRTIDNVVNYINTQLKAAKVNTSFSAANLGKAPVTTTLAGKTTTTNTGDPQWGLTVNGNSNENVSFSAPVTGAAVYVGMSTGGATTFAPPSSSSSSSAASSTSTTTTTPTGEQLLKLQTTPTAPQQTGSTLPVGGVFAKNLPSGVTSVQASATASDGSVYVLADASGTIGTTPVPGTQGVALLKYDPAGKLLYTKVLPGEQNATGFSLAVSSNGSVAIAGTNTTDPSVSLSGIPTLSTTSAFVQVYDSTGAPTFSQTVPTLGGASAASGVAFGADGSVYLSGATTGSVGNQIEQGSSDEFIQGFDKTGKATFTTQYGAKGGVNSSAGMAFDPSTGTLYTAGTENGKAVVRSFALNGSLKPTPVNTRILGSATNVVGIGLAGGQVVVAGNVTTKTINAANVASPYTGVGDGFIMSMATSLTAQPSDTVTYIGQAGATTTATALTVSGGQAYLTGTVANDPHSLAAHNATEGFVSGIDATTGAITYSSKFPGANGQATPTAISVAATGSSVLDQLGLPQGPVNAANSSLITAATPIKAGSSFYVRTSPGGPQAKLTITATDTLTTLANKLNLVLNGQGTASVVAIGANSQLSIQPISGGYIELDPQLAANQTAFTDLNSSNTDVLSGLGLPSGVIRTVNTINGLTDINQLREYGLNLPTNLNLSTAANAQHASNAIQASMFAVQKAYQDLVSPPTRASEQAAAQQSSGGSVPAYLTAQIANYAAGLQRLTAGQNTSSSSNSGGILSLF
jgi:hypothetical protein